MRSHKPKLISNIRVGLHRLMNVLPILANPTVTSLTQRKLKPRVLQPSFASLANGIFWGLPKFSAHIPAQDVADAMFHDADSEVSSRGDSSNYDKSCLARGQLFMLPSEGQDYNGDRCHVCASPHHADCMHVPCLSTCRVMHA